MGQKSSQIEQHIEHTRAALGSNLQELEHKVKDATDWRQQFQRNPLTMMGVAFGGGILLSTVMGSHHGHRGGNPYDAAAGHQNRHSESGKAVNSQMKRASDTWDSIKGALIGVAAGQVQTFLKEAVPGFRDELQRVQKREHPEIASDRPIGNPASEPTV